jgi:putative ferrous iron transport protein C
MITLSGLREYLSERRQASVAEMTLHFDASADAVRGALSHWLAKGRARRLDPGGICSGCGCGCGCKGEEVFEWLPDVARP